MSANPAEIQQGHPVVEACAGDRAAIVPAPLTIAEGIFRARQMLRTAEQLGPNERAVITSLLAAIEYSPTYAKAITRGQEVFVLVEQDRAAPFAIRQWAEVAEKRGAPPEKVLGAQIRARCWEEAPAINTKWPD